MSYQRALEAAGAEVLAMREFGSYRGDWWALVKLPGQKKPLWVTGSYGSCSGCDAFQAEFFGYSNQYWNYETDEFTPAGLDRLREFGRGYLEGAMTYEEALRKSAENYEWDCDVEDMVKWIEQTWESYKKEEDK